MYKVITEGKERTHYAFFTSKFDSRVIVPVIYEFVRAFYKHVLLHVCFDMYYTPSIALCNFCGARNLYHMQQHQKYIAL